MSTLEIKNLHVSVETADGPKQILRGVNLTINSGEIHAVMGPNGSGKSTLSYAIAGHPKYEITEGEVLLDGENIVEMSADERARAGLFLAMQYPVEVTGVTVTNFLRTAKTAIDGEAPKLREWVKSMKQAMSDLKIDEDFSSRDVNVGFSEGKRSELRFSSSKCSSQSLRYLTKLILVSTSTHCVWSPKALIASMKILTMESC